MSNYITYLSDRLNERGDGSAILTRPEIDCPEICLHMEATATQATATQATATHATAT